MAAAEIVLVVSVISSAAVGRLCGLGPACDSVGEPLTAGASAVNSRPGWNAGVWTALGSSG